MSEIHKKNILLLAGDLIDTDSDDEDYVPESESESESENESESESESGDQSEDHQNRYLIDIETILLHQSKIRKCLFDIRRIYYSRDDLNGDNHWCIHFKRSLRGGKTPQIQAITCKTCGNYTGTANEELPENAICHCCVRKFCEECLRYIKITIQITDDVICEHCGGFICDYYEDNNAKNRCTYCRDYLCSDCLGVQRSKKCVKEVVEDCDKCGGYLCVDCKKTQKCLCVEENAANTNWQVKVYTSWGDEISDDELPELVSDLPELVSEF